MVTGLISQAYIEWEVRLITYLKMGLRFEFDF